MKKYLTIKEQVKEWEGFDLCAPSSNWHLKNWNCEGFNNDCHRCLFAYAATIPDNKRISLLWSLKHLQPMTLDTKEIMTELEIEK